MPIWAITGGSGFLGRHLLAALRDKPELTTIAVGRTCPPGCSPANLARVDLSDPGAIRSAFSAILPDVVIHAAGRTPPADRPLLYQANTVHTLNLLDALRDLGLPARVVLAGSAAELGPVAVQDLPVSEDYPCRPVEAYGLSKWLATCAGLVARPPLQVISARIFNPIGPGLTPNQAFGRFAALLADPATTTFEVGDLDTRRDFVDIRDVANALIAIAEGGEAGGVYNVGTGRSERIGDGLDRLMVRSGRRLEIRVNPAFKAAPGPRDSRASIAKIVSTTGWKPRVSFQQSLDDLWYDLAEGRGLTLTPP